LDEFGYQGDTNRPRSGQAGPGQAGPGQREDSGVAVTLDVWRVPPRAVPAALWRVAWLPRVLRRRPDVGFVKLLGTGRGSSFGIGAGDPCRWAALTVWRGSPRPLATFDRIATAHCRLALRPIASRGRWARRDPFATADRAGTAARGGPVLVLTRARIRPTRAAAFWRAIGPVAATLPAAPGLLATFGVGEAPIGFQGTVSIWADSEQVNRFAYRTAEHAAVVAATPARRWYAEDLFARMAVLDVTGDREVIGWNAERA
jgi:hypothetical protein